MAQPHLWIIFINYLISLKGCSIIMRLLNE
jgi:hypothetical protein